MVLPISIIAAVSRNGVIGNDGRMPWRLPRDLSHFRENTVRKPVIMGRRTFESIGGRLSSRVIVVVSGTSRPDADGVVVATSFAAAVARASAEAIRLGAKEIMVAGGAKVYAEALPKASRLLLTFVDADVQGDTFFPSYDTSEWSEFGRTRFDADDRNEFPVSFVEFRRDN